MQSKALFVLTTLAIAGAVSCTLNSDDSKVETKKPTMDEQTAETHLSQEIFDPFDSSHSFFMLNNQDGSRSLVLSGEITPKTLQKVKQVLSALPESGASLTALSSLGGDVEAAIEIGRMLRERRMTVLVAGPCASACVLVYAGGATRIATSTNPIIIHRPYFSDGDQATTREQAQANYEKLGNLVRDYLQDMNVSPALWDAMVAVDPSDSHILTSEEQNKFGLLARDPVEDEMRRQDFAKKLGISASEFVRREALTKQACAQATSLEEASVWTDCYQRIMRGTGTP